MTPLGVIVLVVLVDLLGFTLVMPLLAPFAEQYGFKDWQIGFLFSAYPVCQLVAGPILGRLSDVSGEIYGASLLRTPDAEKQRQSLEKTRMDLERQLGEEDVTLWRDWADDPVPKGGGDEQEEVHLAVLGSWHVEYPPPSLIQIGRAHV